MNFQISISINTWLSAIRLYNIEKLADINKSEPFLLLS